MKTLKYIRISAKNGDMQYIRYSFIICYAMHNIDLFLGIFDIYRNDILNMPDGIYFRSGLSVLIDRYTNFGSIGIQERNENVKKFIKLLDTCYQFDNNIKINFLNGAKKILNTKSIVIDNKKKVLEVLEKKGIKIDK